ncbi:hypothetical protein EXU48_22475 [Occultella glacieicola]|uniref:Uncharacterized protein n=1 Tax=Occultella glacieicola TaxID=2518684 RepID=A0ABY2DXI3_9MICO|nr:hypothetical protein [Occultella glacieicola]TDE88846.1 hypothetical protein EXU48_22475 [Occultella glacieicola]
MSTLEQGDHEPEGEREPIPPLPGAPAEQDEAAPVEGGDAGGQDDAVEEGAPVEEGDASPADPPAVLAPDVIGERNDTSLEPAAGTDPGVVPQEEEPPAWAGSAERISDPTTLDLAAIADRRRVRRAPRFGRFAGFGVALGVIIAFALSRMGVPTEYLDRGGMFLLLVALLAPFCALVACLIAVLLDRTHKRDLRAEPH